MQSLLPQAGEKSCTKNNMHVGVVGNSMHLAVNQRYQRNAEDTDRPAGGVDLKCQYLFNVEHQNFETEIIYMDNFFSTPWLFTSLYFKKVFCCWTVCVNRKEMPGGISSCKLKNHADHKILERNESVATAWRDKKTVLLVKKPWFKWTSVSWGHKKMAPWRMFPAQLLVNNLID